MELTEPKEPTWPDVMSAHKVETDLVELGEPILPDLVSGTQGKDGLNSRFEGLDGFEPSG